MNLKRIGTMSLVAGTLASASLFGATAAQAGGAKTWSGNFDGSVACVSAVHAYEDHVKQKYGAEIVSSSCTPVRYYFEYTEYKGTVKYKV